MKNGKLFVIIGGIIIAAALTFTVGIQSAQNRAIGLEESVYTAESDITSLRQGGWSRFDIFKMQ